MHTVRRSLLAPLVPLLVAVSACTRAPMHDLAHDLAGLPAAGAMHGVRIGMSEAELRKLRPAAAASKGTLRETADGYAMIYVLNTAVPERSVTVIHASREFATEDSLAAAWYAAFDAGRDRIGSFASCDTMQLSAGAIQRSPLRVAMWHTGPIFLSAISHAGRTVEATRAVDGQAVHRTMNNALDITVAGNDLLEQSVTAVMETFAPKADRSCRATSLDGAPREPHAQVVVSERGHVLNTTP